MKISKSELSDKYGIDLPRGKYNISINGSCYKISTVKDDTDGCLLVGKNKIVGRVVESKATFTTLMNKYLTPARKRKQRAYITIK